MHGRDKRGINVLGEVMVIAGSSSNIIDRMVRGGVVDFIEFSYKNWAWPTFNIADAAIVVGVFFMLMQLLRKVPRSDAHISMDRNDGAYWLSLCARNGC